MTRSQNELGGPLADEVVPEILTESVMMEAGGDLQEPIGGVEDEDEGEDGPPTTEAGSVIYGHFMAEANDAVSRLYSASGKDWTIYCADALSVLRVLPDHSVDAIMTDAPYSSGGFTRGDRMAPAAKKYTQTGTIIQRPDFAGDNRDQRSFAYWCAMWLSECRRVARPGAPICLFSDWRQLPSTTDALQAGGWVWRGIFVWDKTEQVRPALGRFASQCEFVAWGSHGPMPRDRLGRVCLSGLLRVQVRRADKHHLVGKPTAVMRHIVQICPRGGLILDPFAGSGTTGVAALLEGRRFMGVELGGSYFDNSCERLRAVERGVGLEDVRSGQLSLFEVA